MGGCPWRSRAPIAALSTAGLVVLFTTSTAAAAAPEEAAKAAPEVQRPAALDESAEAAPPGPEEPPAAEEAPAEAPAPEGEGGVPEAPEAAETVPPSPEAIAEEGSEESDSGSPPEDGVDPSLLEGDPGPAVASDPTPRARPQVQDDAALDAALARAYQERYRPAGNPGRLNLGVRALFANAGGGQRIGGRMGGAQVDVGQSWNHIGYAVTGQFWGGRVFLPDRVAEMNVLVGGGPTLNLGRLALVGRGYLDFRVGYDFFYGAVNQRRSDPTIVAPQDNPNIRLEQAENLAPHGPRVQLNMGLLSASSYRRFIHGFGVSMGYQGLVGSFRGSLPFTHMLTLGFSYWMG